MKRINVGYVSDISPGDRHALSGTPFRMYKALSKQNEINLIWIPFRGNLFTKWLNVAYKILNRTIMPHFFPEKRSLFIHQYIANKLDQKLLERIDVFFCYLTQLHTERPVVYMSDALYNEMVGYYFDVPRNSRQARLGDKLQRLVVENASHLVFPSQWAADDAIRHYGQSRDKISIIKFGPNIDETDIVSLPHTCLGGLVGLPDSDSILNILFLGVDWKRKGGELAVNTVKWLNENGVKSVLHIVGIKDLDPKVSSLLYVSNWGRLNKNDEGQYQRLIEIIRKCKCMLLPTMAECAGIAFVETSAYGLPSFTHDTGGVKDYVLNGVNGYTLPLGATPEDFGRKIKECLLSGELEKMSESAINLYKTTLNWNHWAKEVTKVLVDVAKANRM